MLPVFGGISGWYRTTSSIAGSVLRDDGGNLLYGDFADTGGGTMPKIILSIDRDLQVDLTEAGLDIEQICRTALEAEAIHVRAKRAEADDQVLYQRGFSAGAQWAADRAATRELREIAEWSNIRWRQFSLVPARNSFVYAYCEAVRQDYPRRDETFYLANDAFTRGMVDGAAAFLLEL